MARRLEKILREMLPTLFLEDAVRLLSLEGYWF
jgi:hypothetical protein